MARDPTTPADPGTTQDTEVDPSNLDRGDGKTTGMTSEEYQAALDAIPGGYFYDIPSDVDGALSPGEVVPQFSDLSPEDRKIMTRKLAKKRAERERTTVNLAPGDAIKLRDRIRGKNNG